MRYDSTDPPPTCTVRLDDDDTNPVAKFLALNPFRVGEFFLLLANDTAVFQVPLSYRTKLEQALAEHGISCRALTSQQVEEEDQAYLPQRARSRGFAKALVRNVAGPALGAIVSGVASALVGAVQCTVM